KNEDWSFPDPKGMSVWLQQEISDIQRAAELRIKEATAFVTAYAIGEISPKEAEERSYRYSRRWGDVIPGVGNTGGMSDEQILSTLDETRIKQRHVSSRIREDAERSR